MPDTGVHYIDEVDIHDQQILLRDDLNVSMNKDSTIADDARLKQSLPTIKFLLEKNNRLIVMSHLGRPKNKEPEFSLKPVAEKMQSYLPGYTVTIVPDFTTADPAIFANQKLNEILMLENIRYYAQEKSNDPEFVKKLASFGQVYVNDAFGVCHRADASVVGLPGVLPAYGGLLLKKEVTMISRIIQNPAKPVVAILGGAKISTKINLIGRLMEVADYLLIGGGLANTFLSAQGLEIGKSFIEYDKVENARRLLFDAAQKHTAIMLPSDVIVGNPDDKETGGILKKINELGKEDQILDLGPETQAKYGAVIAKAHMIVWNGPVGFIENAKYKLGTDFIYYAITQNAEATSIVGGGDTLAAISKDEYLDKITHISTGGGAMLEFIEKGTLPGIEALKK